MKRRMESIGYEVVVDGEIIRGKSLQFGLLASKDAYR